MDSQNQLAVSPTEAAKLLGISRSKMYQLIYRKDFPAFKLDGRILISVERLRDWVNRESEVRL